jgi:hypothetical protein
MWFTSQVNINWSNPVLVDLPFAYGARGRPTVLVIGEPIR